MEPDHLRRAQAKLLPRGVADPQQEPKAVRPSVDVSRVAQADGVRKGAEGKIVLRYDCVICFTALT